MAQKRFTTNEAAKACGITSGYLRSKMIAGKVKAVKFGRDWSISRQEVERLGKQLARETRGRKRTSERMEAS